MASKKPKNTLHERMQSYAAIFGEDSCCPAQNISSIEEIDQAIGECKAMLYEAIERSDRQEISFWRKMLQENKVQKREMLST